ncbi:cytochrome P450 [Kineobactrum salinum]|uniref:Cytochrome P450 n=1 Tax=Kineobactrum salinum TaxID=2708301 RepID=A0A6C0U545_9GAMM|nr:cytochrome P450 [Kineobactrum salinum]QIB66539.1 cytochrome P450 [Kineobactrum salinum]
MSGERPDDWSPLGASILKDQRRAYDEMRERCPVAHSEFMGWSLFRHEEIAAVLADSETYSNVSQFLAIPNGMDPPDHGRYRKALDPNFDREQMARVEPLARGIAAGLLGPLHSGIEVEFINAFATPFALKTLCAILGWSERQWDCLGGWVHGSQQAAFNKDPVAGKHLASLFSEHVKANLDARLDFPNDVADTTDALMRTEVDGVPLDDDQIVSILRNWTAGQGTVAASLGILVLHLAQETDLQERLRKDPSLVPAAIEEILRTDGPLVANPRITTRAVKINGRSIPKGAHLTLMWIAANRDPRAFEEPGAVKIERDTADGLVWGQGIHFCQGAPLARLELRVAIEELLAKTKGFELVGDNDPDRDVFPGNGFANLPLRFS